MNDENGRDDDDLLIRLEGGDERALTELFTRHRERRRRIRLRLDRRLQEMLNAMEPLDREVLALRHFEELSNGEVAQVLGLSKTAASNRYIRALERLKERLEGMPGFRAD